MVDALSTENGECAFVLKMTDAIIIKMMDALILK